MSDIITSQRNIALQNSKDKNIAYLKLYRKRQKALRESDGIEGVIAMQKHADDAARKKQKLAERKQQAEEFNRM
jgi:hypothetical protein